MSIERMTTPQPHDAVVEPGYQSIGGDITVAPEKKPQEDESQESVKRDLNDTFVRPVARVDIQPGVSRAEESISQDAFTNDGVDESGAFHPGLYDGEETQADHPEEGDELARAWADAEKRGTLAEPPATSFGVSSERAAQYRDIDQDSESSPELASVWDAYFDTPAQESESTPEQPSEHQAPPSETPVSPPAAQETVVPPVPPAIGRNAGPQGMMAAEAASGEYDPLREYKEGPTSSAATPDLLAGYTGEQTPPSPTPEAPIVPTARPDIETGEAAPEGVYRKFQERFGISQEQLQAFQTKDGEGNPVAFEDLDDGQKLLVYENLSQITLGRIQAEALEQYHSDSAEANMLGRLWKGVTKNYQIAQLEKEKAKDVLERKGLEVHKDILEVLVRGTQESGVGVEEVDGKMELRYLSGNHAEHALGVSLSESEKAQFEEWNKACSGFSKVSYEDSLNRSRARKRYDESLDGIVDLFLQHGKSELDATRYVLSIDEKVRRNQFCNVNPNVEKALQKIESPQVWDKVVKDYWVEHGSLAAFGFAARTAAVGILGTSGALAAPVVGAVFGGVRGYVRAHDTLAERDRLQRRGVKDESAQALEFVDVEQTTNRLETLVNQFYDEDRQGDAETVRKRVDRLSTRVEFALEALDNGRINFGGGTDAERTVRQYNFMRVLAQAQAIAPFEEERTEEVRQRLDEIFGVEEKEKDVKQARSSFVRHKVLMGASLGVAFSALGGAVRNWWSGGGTAHAAGARVPASGASKVPGASSAGASSASASAGDPTGASAERVTALHPEGFLGKGAEEAAGVVTDEGAIPVAEPPAPTSEGGELAPPEAMSEFGPKARLKIGTRGIIGSLEKRLMETQGMSKDEAGTTAFRAWFELRKSLLQDDSFKARMEELGYTPNRDGIEQMMRRISDGDVLVDPKTGNLELDAEFLKPKIVTAPVDGASLAPTEQLPGIMDKFVGETQEYVRNAAAYTFSEGESIETYIREHASYVNQLESPGLRGTVMDMMLSAERGMPTEQIAERFVIAGSHDASRLYNTELFSGVMARMKGDILVLGFNVRDNMLGVSLEIRPDGTFGVNGHGGQNWPKNAGFLQRAYAPLTVENLEEAMKFINDGSGNGAVSIANEAVDTVGEGPEGAVPFDTIGAPERAAARVEPPPVVPSAAPAAPVAGAEVAAPSVPPSGEGFATLYTKYGIGAGERPVLDSAVNYMHTQPGLGGATLEETAATVASEYAGVRKTSVGSLFAVFPPLEEYANGAARQQHFADVLTDWKNLSSKAGITLDVQNGATIQRLDLLTSLIRQQKPVGDELALSVEAFLNKKLGGDASAVATRGLEREAGDGSQF